MISKNRLQEAAEKNIIQNEQVEPLYEFLQQEPAESIADNREEPLKFIRNFGDVYISLGVILLLIAINLSGISGIGYLVPVAAFVLLAEWLVRKRRLVLPGMVILLSILFLMYKALIFESDSAFMGFTVLSVTSFLFYFRYQMPFSLLPLASSLLAMFIIILELDVFKTPIIFAGCGIIIFAVAMWFDSRDTKRISHLSDGAFWLHLLAAPLIVHGLMVTMLTSEQAWVIAMNKEILILVFFAMFFLIALLVDRRSMLISTQLYIIYAIIALSIKNSSSFEDVIIYVLIALGMFVIYFGAYWYKTRQIIYGWLSDKALSRYIPELSISDMKR